uniref:Uncharacterized protein n=1 Tax=Anopheles maculatus TaxID=74869 RepID=A0A182SW72_9DIPT
MRVGERGVMTTGEGAARRGVLVKERTSVQWRLPGRSTMRGMEMSKLLLLLLLMLLMELLLLLLLLLLLMVMVQVVMVVLVIVQTVRQMVWLMAMGGLGQCAQS